MRVTHICNLLLPPEHPDYGRVPFHPGRWVLNLAVAQKKYSNIAPELLVQVPGASHDFEIDIEGVPIHFVKAPDRLRSATFFFFDVRRLAARVRDLAPDVVHGHGTEDAYSLAAQHTGMPNIITAQGLHCLINRKVKPALVSREEAVQFTEWLAFKRARAVITKSEYVATELKARFPHLILHAIPNTFDERILDIHEPKRPNSLVFVGTISPWKGIDNLRQALLRVSREIPQVSLDVAGDSPDAALPYEIEQKQLLREALGDRVTFHGRLKTMELARLVASSMALVAPSLEDMFGNQVVEALLLRTQTIVAEGTALAETVARFGNGTIVARDDPQALSDAILDALTRPVSETTAQRTRNEIAEAFGPATVARRHSHVYEQIRQNH